MKFGTKQFVILLAAGMIGVFSLSLIDLTSLVAILSIPSGTEIPEITWGIKLLGLAQYGLILTVAVFIGLKFAHRVNLTSPLSGAISKKEKLWPALAPQLLPGICAGIAGGLMVILATTIWKPFWPSEVVMRITQLGEILPLPTRIFYGGITEELLLRWGFMSFLVWGGWRLFQKSYEKPSSALYVLMILTSSLVFAVGHLPMAYLLSPDTSMALISYVIVANSAFGFIEGYLFWKKGLEASIIAHICAHLTMFTANYL